LQREGVDIDNNGYIKPENFYICLREFLDSDIGTNYEDDLRFDNSTDNPLKRQLLGFKFSASFKRVTSIATQGPALLTDIRRLSDKYGPSGTFSFAQDYLDFEQYYTF